MRLTSILLFFISSVTGAPFHQQRPNNLSPLPRLILYHQTTHTPSGHPISLLPLITNRHIALTHLIIAAFHVHPNTSSTRLHLNDHPPSSPLFHTLWNETRILQSAGIRVLGIVGGAAPGSFARDTLDAVDDAVFEAAYAPLRDAVRRYGLDGVDLDVEERMSLRGIVRLVRRLRRDFGQGFEVTMAPVAGALMGRGRGWGNLSGFGYAELERRLRGVGEGEGEGVDFYNAQFYSSFGSAESVGDFARVVAAGWDPRRVVIGQLTSPVHGTGFVEHETLRETVVWLRRLYGEIGGIMGWEYFDGVPGGREEPWRWAEVMTKILRPGMAPVLRITSGMAEGLTAAWRESVVNGVARVAIGSGRTTGAQRWAEQLLPDADYMSLVNA